MSVLGVFGVSGVLGFSRLLRVLRPLRATAATDACVHVHGRVFVRAQLRRPKRRVCTGNGRLDDRSRRSRLCCDARRVDGCVPPMAHRGTICKMSLHVHTTAVFPCSKLLASACDRPACRHARFDRFCCFRACSGRADDKAAASLRRRRSMRKLRRGSCTCGLRAYSFVSLVGAVGAAAQRGLCSHRVAHGNGSFRGFNVVTVARMRCAVMSGRHPRKQCRAAHSADAARERPPWRE